MDYKCIAEMKNACVWTQLDQKQFEIISIQGQNKLSLSVSGDRDMADGYAGIK